MTTTTEAPAFLFTAWTRTDNGPWLIAAQADDSGRAWDALLATPSAGRNTERCVIRTGETPQTRRRRF